MNKNEYWCNFSIDDNYITTHEMLNNWKQQNGIIDRCVVHHRDDTEGVRAYNEAHYELWGFNLDGTFEYGKYVVFMTHSDHMRHHHKGNTYMLGYHHTDEAKQKIRSNNAHYWKGKKLSPTHIQNLRDNHQDFTGDNNPFYGKKHTDETKAKISAAHKGKSQDAEQVQKMRETKLKQMSVIKNLYNAYKENGGQLKWNDFQKALKNGEITVEN